MRTKLDQCLHIVMGMATRMPFGHKIENPPDAIIRMLEMLNLATWEIENDGDLHWTSTSKLEKLASKFMPDQKPLKRCPSDNKTEVEEN